MSTARCESINSVMRRKMRRCESSEKSSDAIFSAASAWAALSSRMAPRIVFSASILAGIWASSARSGKVAIPYEFRLSAGSAECSRIWKTRKSGHEILSAPDPGFGTQQAAEKGMIAEENGSDGIPQGLKPIDFIGFIGILRLRSGQARSRARLQSPMEGVFPQPVKPVDFRLLMYGLKPVPFTAGSP